MPIKAESKHASGRNVGLDALKVLAMLFIVLHHVMQHGGILQNLSTLSDKCAIVWLVYTVSCCAVNCYALISGYVGVKAQEKPGRLLMYWLQVVFYAAGISVICWMLFPDRITLRDCLMNLMPVTTGTYWYFTGYFCIMVFSPLFNCAIQSMTERKVRSILVMGFVLFSIIPAIRNRDAFYLRNGWSMVWLGYLYLVGGYIRIHASETSWYQFYKRFSLAIFFVCVLFAWGWKVCLERGWVILHGVESTLLIRYTSPMLTLASIALLIFFKECKWRFGTGKIIFRLSALTFGVYLIHDHPFVRDCFMKDHFMWMTDAFDYKMLPFAMAGVSAMIFAFCATVEWLRIRLFVMLKIQPACFGLMNKLNDNRDQMQSID